MDLGITGKTALVMSAGGGLGSAIALALAREGVSVAVSDRSEEALARTVARIRDARGVANGYVADLGRLETLDELVASVTRDLGAPDILVNNTGGPAPCGIAGVPAQTWRSQFDAMVLSVMHLTDLVLPAMRSKGWGRIVTSTSSGVIAPIANLGVSNALRTALRTACANLPRYVEGMTLCAEACLRARWQERDPAHADRAALDAAISRLAEFGEKLRQVAEDPEQPHQVVMLLDYRRVADIVAGARQALASQAA